MSQPLSARSYTVLTMRQVAYLRAHYRETPAPELAAHFGLSVRQLYAAANRHGITKRAPNGAPEWRERRQPLAQAA